MKVLSRLLLDVDVLGNLLGDPVVVHDFLGNLTTATTAALAASTGGGRCQSDDYGRKLEVKLIIINK